MKRLRAEEQSQLHLLTEREARIREVVEGPEGARYVLTDAADGELLRLVP